MSTDGDPRSGILHQPLSPGPLRTCPHCDKARALELLREEPDETHDVIRVFRCRFCDEITEFAASLGPEAV